MTAVFESILHMSAVASIVILTVIVLRFCLKNAPKKFSYILWAVVLLRLLCPFTVESALSTLPRNNGAVELLEDFTDDYVGSMEVYFDNTPEYDIAIDAGIEPIYMPEGGSYVNVAPDGVSEPPTVETEWMPILSVIWLCGIAAMALWAVIDYLRLRSRLRTAIREGDGVYMTDAVDSPFVLGLFRPKIYLPAALGESEREYILLHERCHLRRGDHWIKLLAFAALAIHWFNPLVWLVFVLANRDMEMSCDEAVIKSLGAEVRADYSASLLALATGRRRVSVTPLAFGEGDPKGRIRNLANWRKPTVWIIIAAVAVCIIAAVCLLTDPVEREAQIRVNGRVYTYVGSEETLTGRIWELGTLESIVHRSDEEPERDFYGTNLDEKYAGQPLYAGLNGRIYLFDEDGFFLPFELSRGEIVSAPTEVARGDFNRDGQSDFIIATEYSDMVEIVLVDSRSAETLWTDTAFEDAVNQKCFIARVGEDGLDYIICDSYNRDTDEINSRTFYIENGEEVTVDESVSYMPKLPETDSEAEFIELMSLSLPQNSTVLLSTLGGITVVGPVNRPAEASPTEVARGDFDHDGVEETVTVVPDGQYGDMWDLCVTDPDGKVIWAEENFHTSHPGWNSILSTSIAGRDYLVRYNPYMSTGIASYVCEVFYIQNGEEVTLQEWRAEFTTSYNPPMEITSEMAEFAAAVNDLAPRCTLLFSTLDGEVLTGPVSAVESGVMTVDYLLDHCRALVQQVGWSDYYSFESKYYIDGEYSPEYPSISAWVCGDDWLYRGESVAEGGVTRHITILKDGRQYAWLSAPGKELINETDSEDYDSYFSWLRNGGFGKNLSFVSDSSTGDGRTLNYVEYAVSELGTVSSGTHSYVLDENGALESYSMTGSGAVRTVTFSTVSEAMCRAKINEAYEELLEALELDALDPINIYGLEDGLCDGSFGLRWGTKESYIANQTVYKAEALSDSQTRYDYAGVANLCFADVPCAFSAHCTDGVLSGITMRFAAEAGERVKTIEKVYKLLKSAYGDVDIYEEPVNGAYADFGVYAGSHRWDVKSGEGETVVVRLAVNGENSFVVELGLAASEVFLPIKREINGEVEATLCLYQLEELLGADALHIKYNYGLGIITNTCELWRCGDDYYLTDIGQGYSWGSLALAGKGYSYEQTNSGKNWNALAKPETLPDLWHFVAANYEREYIGTENRADGYIVSFRLETIGWSSEKGETTEKYFFDEDGALYAISLQTDMGTDSHGGQIWNTRNYHFLDTTEKECREAIEAGYGEYMSVDAAIIDDGSSYPLAIPYGKTVVTDLDGDGVMETVCQSLGYRKVGSLVINGVEFF